MLPRNAPSHCSPSLVMLLGRAVLAVTQGAHGGAGVWSRVPSTQKPSPSQSVVFDAVVAVVVWVGGLCLLT